MAPLLHPSVALQKFPVLTMHKAKKSAVRVKPEEFIAFETPTSLEFPPTLGAEHAHIGRHA
jgi:hypothetical protein